MPEPDTVLVATDFGEIADRGLGVAEELARALAAELCIVHVVAPLPFMVEQYIVGPSPGALDVAQRSLEQRARTVTTVPARTLLRDGDPARTLVAVVAETAPRLVVVGTHGRQGPSRLLLGSVAEAIVRASAVPVVTVNPHAAGLGERADGPVLVAIDRDPIAERALAVGRDLARALGRELVLLHVDHLTHELEWGDMTAGDFHTDVEDGERFVGERAAAVGGARTILRSGEPAATTLDVLGELRPVLAVIGTHGRRGLARVVFGSVAERVLREAVVPVVAVHAAEAASTAPVRAA